MAPCGNLGAGRRRRGGLGEDLSCRSLAQAGSFFPVCCASSPRELVSASRAWHPWQPPPASPTSLLGWGPLKPVNCFIRLKQTSAKEEKQNLNWRPLGTFAETDGRGSNEITSYNLCAELADKTPLPSNRALLPGGPIRGLEELCVWKM